MSRNEYDDILQTVGPHNEYDALLSNKSAEAPLRASMTEATKTTPERQAEVLKLSNRTLLPPDMVDRNFDYLKQKTSVESNDYDRILKETPHLAKFLSDPNNAKLAHDDLGALGTLEKVFDAGRSLAASVPSLIGTTTAGAGDLLDLIQRRTFGKPQGPISTALQEAGQAWKDIGELWIAPPKERQNFGTELAGSVGQVGTMIGQALVAPETVLPSLMAQGADPIHETAVRTGKAGTWRADLAEAGGAGVMGVLGKFGLDKLIDRVPPQIQNMVVRRFADLALSAGYQGVVQAAQSTATHILQRAAGDPNQPIVQGIAQDFLLGSLTGGIARGVTHVALPEVAKHFERAQRAKQSQAFFDALGQAVPQSKTFQRLPEKLQELVLRMTKDGPIENVYLPVEDIRNYAQSQNVDPGELMESITKGGRDKFNQAAGQDGADVEVPIADYATKIAPTEAAQHFNDAVRLGDPEAMNQREARAFETETRRNLQPGNALSASEIDRSSAQVGEDIRGQMADMGLMPAAVDAYARLYQHVFRTIGERSGVDPFALYDQYKLKILRPLPEVLAKLPDTDTRLDTLLDRLRAGQVPGQAEMFGKSLLAFIREKGGVQDEGGDLASREIDKERKPFERNVINPEGLPMDKAREAAAEAGYLDKQSSITDFMDVIDKEVRGEPVYAQGQENAQAIEQSIQLEQLNQFLKSRDIDIRTASNADIKKVLQQAAAAPSRDIDARTGQVLDQAAYHGSPHAFDRFDISKIGTGEGAQAYGWGLYFAGRKEVAQYYKDAMADFSVQIDGQRLEIPMGTVDDIAFGHLEEAAQRGERDPFAAAADVLNRAIHALEKVPATLETNRSLDRFNQAVNVLNRWREQGATISNKGRLYHVDIPEDSEYLDYDKPLSEDMKAKLTPEAMGLHLRTNVNDYSSYVNDAGRAVGPFFKGAAEETIRQRWIDDVRAKADKSGRELYTWLALTPKEASEALLKAGIPGIRYLDQASRRNLQILSPDETVTKRWMVGEIPNGPRQFFDNEAEARDYYESELKKKTSNYVLFDDSLAKITKYEQRLELEKRGDISFGDDRKMSIRLLENADLSTFLHESGHFYLEVFGDAVDQLRGQADLGDAQKRMVADYDTLLKNLGVESREAIGRDQHEQFARSFEAYLREGKAPAPELRGMFQRFKAWLTNIYRSLAQLNVNLSPEVRGIFDRLVATDEQIGQAEQDANVRAMIEDQGQAERLGLSPAEFRAYGDTVRKARDDAKDALYDEYLDEYNERQSDWYANRRSEVRDEVSQEVHGQRDYIALSFLKDGTLPDGSALPDGVQAAKLDAGALEERYGKYKNSSIVQALRKLDVYRREGGVDPDQAAQLFGYSSGDEMVQAILKLRPMDALIDGETDDRMRQTYGDMLTDGTAPEKARDAVMTSGRSKVIEAEMKALAKKVRETAPFRALGANEAKRADREARAAGADTLKRFVPSLSLARDIAESRISDMKVRDVKPGLHYSAARREGNAAIEAVNRGDFENALMHKQRELVNVEMFRAARNLVDEVSKARDYFQGFDKADKRQRIGKAGGGYLEQIDKLLDRFDFSKKPLKDVDKMASLADFIKAQADQGHELDIPAELVNEAGRKNYRDMTVSELRGLKDAVKSIEHWANFKNKLLRNQAKRELDALAADGVASIDGNSRGPRKTNLEMRLPGSQKGRTVESFFLSHLPMGSILREMDGFKDGGFLFENVMRPIDEAGNAEALRTEKATTAVMDLYRGAYKGEESGLWQKQFVPEINDSLTKWGRLMVALNWGNDGNRRRVLSGFGWNEGQVQAILNTLDKRDWDFVQGMWDHIDSYWPEIAAKQKRVTGVEPEQVQRSGVQTKFGEMKGGYFPIVYEGRLSARAAGNPEASFAKLIEQSSYTKATTARGHTEARAKNVSMPLRLDPGVITEHLQQVIHDLTHHEMLIDVGRLLGRKEIQDSIYRNYGDVAFQELKSHIRDIALGATPAPSWYRTFAAIRSNAVTARLGWNMVTALVHVPNITSGMVRVGPQWVVKGVIDSLSSAKGAEHSAQWVAEQSDMMRLRWSHRMVELAEFRDEIGLNRGKLATEVRDAAGKVGIDADVFAHFKDSYLYTIHRILQFAEIPTWVGAYEKAVNGGREPADARAMADRAILDAIGGGQMKDVASVQKGAIGKIFTTFMTYQLSMHRLGREVLLKDESALRKTVDASLLALLPMAFVTAVHHFARPSKNEDFLGEMKSEMFDHAVGMFAGVRELAGAFRKPDYSGPASFGVITSLRQAAFKLAKSESKGEVVKGTAKAINEAAGELFGYPASQVDKTLAGILALWEGKTRNPSAILFGPPKK